MITTRHKYIVQPHDTLEGIAARHDCTVGQLMTINRLCSRVIFSGQQLFVPDPADVLTTVPPPPPSSDSPPPVVPLLSSSAGNTGGVPLRVDRPLFRSETIAVGDKPRVKTPPQPSSFLQTAISLDDQDAECLRRFLKFPVQRVVGKSVRVDGVMLVTPNCIMFDPNVSDPLVIANGAESYEMIAEMGMIISVALYKSSSELTYRSQLSQLIRDPHPFQQAFSDISNLSETEAAAIQRSHQLSRILRCTSTVETGILLFGQSADVSTPLPMHRAHRLVRHRELFRSASASELPIGKRSENDQQQQQQQADNGHEPFDMFKNAKACESKDITGGRSLSVKAETESTEMKRKRSYATFLRLLQKSAERKQNLDSASPDDSRTVRNYLPSVEELLPHKDPVSWTRSPYYLHIVLRLKPPSQKHHRVDAGRWTWEYQSKREVWFSIPREKADDFCSFILRCSPESEKPSSPHTGQTVNDVSPPTTTTFSLAADDSAFVVVSGEELTGDLPSPQSSGLYNKLSLNREWEIITVEEVKRRLSLFDVVDSSTLPLPDGSTQSKLLDEGLIRKIMDVLPARAQGYPWVLLYSSDRDGFALSTMYRLAGAFKEKTSSCLLVVEDTKRRVFGAIISCLLQVSDHFYGSGESLLFTDYPEFTVFRWTGANDYIVKGSVESLAIGAGKGLYGLWLDSDLYHGGTQRCETFDNCLLTDADFTTTGVELWGFSLGF